MIITPESGSQAGVCRSVQVSRRHLGAPCSNLSRCFWGVLPPHTLSACSGVSWDTPRFLWSNACVCEVAHSFFSKHSSTTSLDTREGVARVWRRRRRGGGGTSRCRVNGRTLLQTSAGAFLHFSSGSSERLKVNASGLSQGGRSSLRRTYLYVGNSSSGYFKGNLHMLLMWSRGASQTAMDKV